VGSNKKQISKSSSAVLLKGQSHEILHIFLRNSFLTVYFLLSRLWFLTFQSCLLCFKGNLVLFTSMKIHPSKPNCTENRCCSKAQILSVKRFRKLQVQSQKVSMIFWKPLRFSIFHRFLQEVWVLARVFQRWALPIEVPILRLYQTKKKISEYRTKISTGLRLSYLHLTSDILIAPD
jgi:hypothetical protein